MLNAAVIRLLAPPVARAGAVEPVRRERAFAPGREPAVVLPIRRGDLRTTAEIARTGTAVPGAFDGSIAFLAHHIAQEVLPPSRAVLDLRLHGHPGLAAYAAMDAADAGQEPAYGAWA